MIIKTILCRMDGTQDTCEIEVPDDYFQAPAPDTEATASETNKG